MAADLGMYVGPGSNGKKRDDKAVWKQQEQIENESVKSGASRISKVSIGSHLSNRAIVK